jgi:hypothetical protein
MDLTTLYKINQYYMKILFKVLMVVLLFGGGMMLIDGILEIINKSDGAVLGFSLNYPAIGLYHFLMGSFLVFLGYKNLVKKQ